MRALVACGVKAKNGGVYCMEHAAVLFTDTARKPILQPTPFDVCNLCKRPLRARRVTVRA